MIITNNNICNLNYIFLSKQMIYLFYNYYDYIYDLIIKITIKQKKNLDNKADRGFTNTNKKALSNFPQFYKDKQNDKNNENIMKKKKIFIFNERKHKRILSYVYF